MSCKCQKISTAIRQLRELVLSDQLERLVVCFPVFVVLIAAVTFIFGGHCAAWQWWGALMLAIGVAKYHCSWRRTVGVVALFFAYLGFIWVMCRVNWVNSWNDYQQYHMPAVRMLIEGWNPLRAATVDSIASTVSVDPATFRPWHVISMCKSAWYFNAVAYFFMGEPYNIMSPAYYCILPAVTLQIWKALRDVSPWARLTVVVIMVAFCEGPFAVVDAIVALAGIGLLMSFREIFVFGRWRWGMLGAFSLWLLTVKQTAGICCVVFWLGFVVTMMCTRRRYFRSCFLMSLVVGLMAIVIDLSPYYSSWRSYGHPLYPCYSVDKQRYPVVDIVSDFLKRNDDAAAMGHLGAAVNAYVSTTLAKAYYAWKLDKPSFSPCADIWEWHHGKGCSSPTNSIIKFTICFSIFICMIIGGRWTRILSYIVIVGMLSVPTQMLGYERYVPWWMTLPLLAVVSISQTKFAHKAIIGIVAAGGVILVALLVFYQACTWEVSFRNRTYLATQLPKEVFSHYKPCMLAAKTRVGPMGDIFRSGRCNVDLLKRQSNDFKNTEVKELNPEGLTAEELESYPTLIFDPLMRLPKGEDVWNGSEYLDIRKEPSRARRMARFPAFAIKSWFYTLPRLMAMRCSSHTK